MTENHQSTDKNIKEHNVKWEDEKISRIWSFYSRNEEFKSLYFAYQAGEQVLKYVNRFFNFKSMHSILDYGSGQGHMLQHLLSGRLHVVPSIFLVDYSCSLYKNIVEH